MKLVAFDTETWVIVPGILAPPLVLGSVAEPTYSMLLSKDEARERFACILDSDEILVGANIAYDVAVMAQDAVTQGKDIWTDVFNLYDPDHGILRGECKGRVFDVQVAEALRGIAEGTLGKDPFTNEKLGRSGRYSLDAVTQILTGREDAKLNDKYRLSYAMFDNWPLKDLPEAARQYPVDDVKNTLDDARRQCGFEKKRDTHRWDGATCSRCGDSVSNASEFCWHTAPHPNLNDHSRQVYAALCLHLGACWGFHIDQTAVAALKKRVEAERAAGIQRFKTVGIIRENGTEDQAELKRMVARAYGASGGCTACTATGRDGTKKCPKCDGTGYDLPPQVPLTPKGGIGKSRDVLQESGDDLLVAYAEFGEGKKLPSTYIPFLENVDQDDVPHPEAPITLSPNVLLETGRASYNGVIQLLPRKGGVRECITARPGRVFSSTDYAAGELVTLAQACLDMVGTSELAKALNDGLDAHLALAGTMMRKSYEEMLTRHIAGDKQVGYYRQGAKAANFGYPGGMAELTFTIRKRGEADLFTPCENGPEELDGVRGYKGLRSCILLRGATRCGEKKITNYKGKQCPPVCEACVLANKDARAAWFKQWPEMTPFFRVVQDNLDRDAGVVTQLRSGRIRGGVDFTSAANGYFQGLLSDAAKNAMCAVTRECYDHTCKSPLLGSRFVLFAHDELICEHPADVAHEAATRVGELMVAALRAMCPNMGPAVKADPALMLRWSKNVKSKYVDGRLVAWDG